MKVVQCWDDGVEDDIRLMEVLRSHNARASFNLNVGLHQESRSCGWKFKDFKEVWKHAKKDLVGIYDGFLVANHTLTHPWLTRIPLNDAVKDIVEGRDALEQMFGYPVTGFAYPFGDHNEEIHKAVRYAGHIYARTVGKEPGIIPPADPMNFQPTCHFLDPEFWTKYEAVKAADGVFYFWGHSYEIITEEDWKSFEGQITRITQDPAAVWTDLPDLFKM